MEISLCIPTHDRYDSFLRDNLEKYIKSPYISEIIIADDATDDYTKLLSVYGDNHPKVKLYRQEVNVGSFKNKVFAASLATKDWICLIDSDNYADERYFEPLLKEWREDGINRGSVYTPSQGLPNFIMKESDLWYVGKREWNKTVPKTLFMNLGNFVFHKSLVPYLCISEYHQHNCHGLCSVYINWIAVKHGFNLRFIKNMAYDHVVHPGSYYTLTSRESDNFSNTFNWFLLDDHLEWAYEEADKGRSKIDNEIVLLDGMTGVKTRHFYNNLLSMPGAVYLEIGTYKGSSVCAAMKNNTANVVCIDNWSEFAAPKNEFLVNFNKHKGNNQATFIEKDCFKVDVSQLPKFNIYMYDGNHDYDAHKKALSHYINCMQDEFIFIVDDWNWKRVREATREVIRELGLKIIYDKEIRLTEEEDGNTTNKETWWNGMYLCVLRK